MIQSSILHNENFTRSEIRSSAFITFLRAGFFILVCFFLSKMLKLSTPYALISAAGVFGVISGTLCSFSKRIRFFSIVFIAFPYVLLLLGYLILAYGISSSNLLLYSTYSKALLALHAFAVGYISTTLFWYFRIALTLELLILLSIPIFLFAAHRNFIFDSPKVFNTLAWTFGVSSLAMIHIIGAILSALLVLYLMLTTYSGSPRPLMERSKRKFHPTHPQFSLTTIILFCFFIALFFFTSFIYQSYKSAAETRTANGVGQEASEGMSPLGFHSALGTSNQPAALVRLDGDYAENPFSPMLYLRESALSKFDGTEMVIAGQQYDDDVTFTSPNEAYAGKQRPYLHSRVPVIQRIYTIADQKNAFGLDYPVSITRLKTPSERFRAAFKVFSYGPGFLLEELSASRVGNPEWDQKFFDHYTQNHSDLRYGNMATEITRDIQNPILKANAIVQYLSKNAIYTLSPGHEVSAGADPVAPFLFGDLRGYCVHFAHAITYMLRSLNIPARIATGYLTDLSQARDGHILLRMSDRHAWAEAYIDEFGWIPFDPQPEQVESHAETPVDMGLLEELMGLLEPGEEILPEDILADEENVMNPEEFSLPDIQNFFWILLSLFGIFIGAKLYLRYSWLLSNQPETRLRRMYRAIISLLYDSGYERDSGETFEEFRYRLGKRGIQTLRLNTAYNTLRYAPGETLQMEKNLTREMFQADRKNASHPKWWKKFIQFFNPISLGLLFQFHGRGK